MSYETPMAAEGMRNPNEGRGWAGLITFAACMLLLLGSFQALAGFVALFHEEKYVVGGGDFVVEVDYTGWGIVHLGIGILLLMAGYALFFRKSWARIVTIVVALISAVVNFAFLPAYPVWSALMIGLNVLIIWAVTAHPFDGNPNLL